MQIIHDNPPENVMAIGKFESMHLGHQALINKAKETAAELGLPTVVMSFVPHPLIVLGNKNYKPLLSTDEVAKVLREICMVDFFLQYPFTISLSLMSPESFCKILFVDLKARTLFVGENYRFGVNRSGTVRHLKKEARLYGANVTSVAIEKRKGLQISTSHIRSLILTGEFALANELLGFNFTTLTKDDYTPNRKRAQRCRPELHKPSHAQPTPDCTVL